VVIVAILGKIKRERKLLDDGTIFEGQH